MLHAPVFSHYACLLDNLIFIILFLIIICIDIFYLSCHFICARFGEGNLDHKEWDSTLSEDLR